MFKVLVDGCAPTRATKYSACVDLYSAEDCVLYPGDTKIIGLGVKIDLAKFTESSTFTHHFANGEVEFNAKKFLSFLSSHYLLLELRSSLRANGVLSGSGIIDLDYPDEIKVIVHCLYTGDDEGYRSIKKGDRIAQATIVSHRGKLMGISSDIERTGGIGSTGK